MVDNIHLYAISEQLLDAGRFIIGSSLEQVTERHISSLL